MTGSFLENQDNPRFQSVQTDQAVSRLFPHLLEGAVNLVQLGL